ncbi:MAG: helix-turn-helix domain-containing protein [Aristaeellaceae bacterium]
MPAKDYNLEERITIVIMAHCIRLDGVDVTEQLDSLAACFGISSSTLRRWEDAYDAHGPNGLVRQGRSDCGESRTYCKWAIERSKLLYGTCSLNGIVRILAKEAQELGEQFCAKCYYAPSCKIKGRGIRFSTRHSLVYALRCANCSNNTDT